MSTAVASRTTTGRCHRHTNDSASWVCTSCAAEFCDACIQEGARERASLESCPKCRSFCRRMESSGPAGPTSIPAILADAVVYPMRGHGVFLIILGGLMVGFLEMVSAYNILFMISLFIGIFASGYFANYMFKIIQHTTMGERNLPTWPDFADILQTILIPFFQMLVAILLSFAPAILPLLVWGITPTGVYGSMAVALYGFFYLPMALLAIALNGSISALKPTVVFPAIRAIIGPYLVIYLALVIIACVSGTLQNVVAENIPILGIMLNAVVSTFFVAMEMRLIGSIYLAHRERIDLF